MHVHTHSVCIRVRQRVRADLRASERRVRSHTLPCEIRLICQWCRSSFMINSPACWKKCFCALATCGTAGNCTRFGVCAQNSGTTDPDMVFRLCWCCKRGGARVNSLSEGLRVRVRVWVGVCVCVWWPEKEEHAWPHRSHQQWSGVFSEEVTSHDEPDYVVRKIPLLGVIRLLH